MKCKTCKYDGVTSTNTQTLVDTIEAKVKRIIRNKVILLIKNKDELEEWEILKEKIKDIDICEGDILKINLFEGLLSMSCKFQKSPKNYISTTFFPTIASKEIDTALEKLKNVKVKW